MRTLPLSLIFITATLCLNAKLVTYDAPEGAPANDQYEVWIREQGQPSKRLFVYDAVVDPAVRTHCGFVYFDADFTQPIDVYITRKGPAANAVRVRPERFDVEVQRPDGNALLTVNQPVKLSVEFDGDIQSPLYIFANTLEQEPITGPSDNVVYYGPGVHYIGDDGQGRVPIEANTIVYIAGGAIVYGRVDFGQKDNVTIRGRGILCGTKFNHDPEKKREQMIYAGNAKAFRVEGITILDAPVWNMHLHNLTDTTIRNVKILAWQRETDGMDPRACQNLVIEDCFVRSGDDSISIKLGNASDPNSVKQSNRNIRVENCIFWPDKAHALLVGPEGAWAGAPEEHVTEDVIFRNIDILRVNEKNPDFYGAMAIMCADGQTIRNITFEDIRIAQVESGNVIDIRFVNNAYTNDYGKGIDNVLFKNINIPVSPVKNRIMGMSEEHLTENIVFQSVQYDGVYLKAPDSRAFEYNSYVKDLKFSVK